MSTFRIALAVMIYLAGAPAVAGPLPDAAMLLDTEIPFPAYPAPVISPDGRWIAYHRDNTVWVRQIADPRQRYAVTVPKVTRSQGPSSPEQAVESILRELGEDRVIALATDGVDGLCWTRNSQEIILGISKYLSRNRARTLKFLRVPMTGDSVILVDSGEKNVSGMPGHHLQLTKDGKSLVFTHASPQIWDVTSNQLMASRFSYLVPSSRGSRWLGVEQTSGQLVLLDSAFSVVRTFDQRLSAERELVDLLWSPDERFAIWREQPRNEQNARWEGVRWNLESSQQHPLEGGFYLRRLVFTGQGGEYLDFGLTESHNDPLQAVVGANLSMVPEEGPPREIWRTQFDLGWPKSTTAIPDTLPLVCDPRWDMFAAGLPTSRGTELRWHLMDRTGRAWCFPSLDSDPPDSSWEVVGLAEAGKAVIVHDRDALFTIPAQAIKTPAGGGGACRARLLDKPVDFSGRIGPVISPDGQWVAYLKDSALRVVATDGSRPAETVARVPFSKEWGRLAQLLQYKSSRQPPVVSTEPPTNRLTALSWWRDSSGVDFGYSQFENGLQTRHFWGRLSISGEVTRLAMTDEASPFGGKVSGSGMEIPPNQDQTWWVLPRPERSTIWDVVNNRPRATPFVRLVPSSTTDRWLAIEKDTTQLVITDNQFQVTKRFDHDWGMRAPGCDLLWSPDERFVLSRRRIGFDYFDNWEGFLLDLQTGKQLALSGQFASEGLKFTGRGGELLRWGASGKPAPFGSTVTGLRILLIKPDKSPFAIWRGEANSLQMQLHHDPYSGLLAVTLPHGAAAPGGHWHLMDNRSKTWPVPNQDLKKYISPFDVIGFAEQGKVIIGHDEGRLFSLPVSAITMAASRR